MIARKAHELTSTTGNDHATRVILMDTLAERELLDNGQIRYSLRSGYAAYYRTRRDDLFRIQSDITFNDNSTLWGWVDRLCTSKNKTYFVCERLDMQIAVCDIFSSLSALDWQLGSWFSRGSTHILEFKKGNKKLICLDIRNYFQNGLDEYEQSHQMDGIRPEGNDPLGDHDAAICRNRVSIMYALWQSWNSFLSDNDLGAFKHTLASTAFNSFRYRFKSAAIYLHDNAGSLALERDSYRGGRVECLFVGRKDDGPYYILDVNSMYGYCMLNYEYPTSLVHYAKGATIDTLKRQLDRYAVVATVDIECDDNPFAFKPTRAYLDELLKKGDINESIYAKLRGRVSYPTGKFRVTLTSPELVYALDCGWIRKVYDISTHTKSKIFRDYIDYFWDLRKRYHANGETAFSQIAKLFTNSLYGKFGQRNLAQDRIGDCAPDVVMSIYDRDLDSDGYSEIVYLGGGIYRVAHTGESYHSYCAIAAHVTSYGRMFLYNRLRALPAKSAFYCDTDSIIVDQRGFDYLNDYVDSDRIGALKIEDTSSWIQINAPKDYATENRARHKGIASGAIELSNGKYQVEEREGLRSMILRRSTSGAYSRSKVKTLNRQILGGIVRPDGWIDPLVIG